MCGRRHGRALVSTKFMVVRILQRAGIYRHLVNTKGSYDVVQGSTAEEWIMRKDGSGKMKDIFSS